MAVTASAFHAAAALVLGQGDAAPEGASLLAALVPGGRPAGGWPAPADFAALLRAGAGFARVFQLPVPAAPGLVAFGAELDLAGAMGPGLAGVSGVGTDRLTAFRACLGEGVELLSQLATPADAAAMRRASGLPPGAAPGMAALLAALPPPSGAVDWMPVQGLADKAPGLAPVDICLRRPPGRRDLDVPWPLSIGCAAGQDRESATLRALLELLERDAVALWWRGGRRGRPLDPGAAEAAAALAARLRGGRADRPTRLLDIGTELTAGLPVSVVAAWSCGPDGRGFCCGTAARTTPQAAAQAALLELCQMELAIAVVEAKRAQRGDSALNPRDEAHRRRFHGIAADCPLLQPLGPPAPPPAAPATAAGLAQALAARGQPLLALELTRPDPGIAVIRALGPGLEMEPGRPPGDRLRALLAQGGGADSLTGGVPLL